MQFSSPGSGVNWKCLKGSLLVFHPLQEVPHGDSAAVLAHVYVVDGPMAGTRHMQARVLPKRLRYALRENLGTLVLGRLVQTPHTNPDYPPAWELVDATGDPDAVALATDMMLEIVNG